MGKNRKRFFRYRAGVSGGRSFMEKWPAAILCAIFAACAGA
jgi:hypothetical protein